MELRACANRCKNHTSPNAVRLAPEPGPCDVVEPAERQEEANKKMTMYWTPSLAVRHGKHALAEVGALAELVGMARTTMQLAQCVARVPPEQLAEETIHQSNCWLSSVQLPREHEALAAGHCLCRRKLLPLSVRPIALLGEGLYCAVEQTREMVGAPGYPNQSLPGHS